MRPDLTTFCRLDELGLQVVGQQLGPDRSVLACRSASRTGGAGGAAARALRATASPIAWGTSPSGGARRRCWSRCARVAGTSGARVVVPDLVAPVVAARRLRDQVQPELFIDELTLRPWRAADAPAGVRAYQDADVQQWHVRTMTDHEAEEWVSAWSKRWAAETGAGWAVCDDRGLLARMSLRSLDLAEGVGEVAYWVPPEARGRGVAPRALQAMSIWLFVDVGLHRLELAHSTRNTESCRVAIKAGYPLEGPSGSKPCTRTAGTTCTWSASPWVV